MTVEIKYSQIIGLSYYIDGTHDLSLTHRCMQAAPNHKIVTA